MRWARQAMRSIGAAVAALAAAAPLASAVTITRIAVQGEVAPHPAGSHSSPSRRRGRDREQ